MKISFNMKILSLGSLVMCRVGRKTSVENVLEMTVTRGMVYVCCKFRHGMIRSAFERDLKITITVKV